MRNVYYLLIFFFWLSWVWVRVGKVGEFASALGLGDNDQKRVYVSERFFFYYYYLLDYGFMVKTNKDLMIVE